MTFARATKQINLFYIPPFLSCTNNAQARNAYGTAAQDIVCQRLRLNPIKIDGRCDVCFDAEKDNEFYEIKSVHLKGKVVIYDWRLEKELASPFPAFYAILVHGLRHGRNDIHKLLLEKAIMILVIPLEKVQQIAAQYPIRTMKMTTKFASTRNGYTRKGYNKGYRNVPVKAFLTQT